MDRSILVDDPIRMRRSLPLFRLSVEGTRVIDEVIALLVSVGGFDEEGVAGLLDYTPETLPDEDVLILSARGARILSRKRKAGVLPPGGTLPVVAALAVATGRHPPRETTMSRQKLLLLSVLALVAVGPACPQPLESHSSTAMGRVAPRPHNPASGDVIAKIGDVTLTVGDIEARLNSQSPFVRARFQTDERKKEFVETQVRFEVLAQEAFRRGMHNDPDVQESLKKILVQKLTRKEFDGRVSLQDVSDEEMRAYYEQHKDDYNKPEMMRTSHIFIPFGADKAAAQKKAEEARSKAADPAKLEDRNHFKALVAEYSADEATQRTGGDLRYLTADEMEERFGKAARDAVFGSQTINEVTGVIEGKEGFHVFKRTGRRKPIERDFEQVKNQIRNVLYREKRTQAFDQFIEGLKKDFGVTVHDANVSKVQVQAGGGVEPMVPGHGHGHDDDGDSDHGAGEPTQPR